MSAYVPRSQRSQETVRDLRAVMENLEFLWERETHLDSSVLVSTSQLRVLYVLERASGVNLKDLADAVGSAPSPLSRLCARLEAMGLVKRLPSPQSGREIELHLTAHATTYLKELREQREHALAAVLDSIAPAPRQALTSGIEALRLALDAHLGTSAGERVARTA